MRSLRGSAIRRLRRRYGWTQVELAKRLGTDAVTVSRWEREVAEPRAGSQTRLRELFSAPGRSTIDNLVRILGQEAAERALRRVVLLERRPAPPWFAVDPTCRLHEIDRSRTEQLEFNAGAKFLRRV